MMLVSDAPRVLSDKRTLPPEYPPVLTQIAGGQKTAKDDESAKLRMVLFNRAEGKSQLHRQRLETSKFLS
jgi:hypothetical protein